MARRKSRRNSTATVVAMEPKGSIYTLQTFRGPGASFGAKAHVRQIRRRAAHGGDYFTGWKAGYAMLKNRRAKKNWSKRDFIRFLTGTLIPDLKASGRVYTARDFMVAVKYMLKPTSRTANFVRYLKSTLIPDLKESGYTATAEDFETAVDFMSAGVHQRRMQMNPWDVSVAWTGKKAGYVSPPGNYGTTGHSELAMHTGGAGKVVVRFALWRRPKKGYSGPTNRVTWAQVEYADGKILDGLPSEVLPEKVRNLIGYASPVMPSRKMKLRLWALSKGVAANRGRKSVHKNIGREHPVWKIGYAVHKFMSKLDLPHLRLWRDVTPQGIMTGDQKSTTARKSSAVSVLTRYSDMSGVLGSLESRLATSDIWQAPLRIIAGAWGMMEEMRSDF